MHIIYICILYAYIIYYANNGICARAQHSKARVEFLRGGRTRSNALQYLQ